MSLKSDTYCLQSNLIVKGPREVSRPKMANIGKLSLGKSIRDLFWHI